MTGQAFTFALEFLGCRTNQEEVDALRSSLLGLGGLEVAFPGPADFVVVNTCALTGSATAQSRRVLRKALRHRTAGRVIATGCAAQLDPHSLRRLDGSALVVGNGAKSDLPTIIADMRSGRWATVPDDLHSSDPTLRRFLSRRGPIAHARARATLKIQDGCPHRCGYCVVSQLRGRPVSRAHDDVLADVARLVANGYREIILTGINLGLYTSCCRPGVPKPVTDGQGAWRLSHLLAHLDDLPGEFRIRLSSLEPMTIDEGLLARVTAGTRLCRHLHLAMQSGDDDVLARMLRPYRAKAFADLVTDLADRMAGCAIGVDVIAGYPGETQTAFERTVHLIRRLPIAYLHAFPFSERPGTPAASLRPSVSASDRKARVRELHRLDRELRERFAARWIDRSCELLVERVGAGRFAGLSREYVRMAGDGWAGRPGELWEFTPRGMEDFVFPPAPTREWREPAGCECG